MIQIHIDPTITSIGPFLFTWHGSFAGLGLLAGIAITFRVAREIHISTGQILNALFWALLVGLIGARLLHVVEAWPFYSQRPWLIPSITQGGLVSYGAVVAGGFAGWWYLRSRGAPLRRLADSAGIGLLAGWGISLCGDILSGEYLSVRSDGPWSVIYSHPHSLAERNVFIHPVPGYEMIWDFSAAALLLNRTTIGSGITLWSSIALFSMGRLAGGLIWRDATVDSSLSSANWLAAAGVAFSLVFLAWIWLRKKGIDPVRNPPSNGSGYS